MAQSRSYRHDTRCIHCGSNWIVKNGTKIAESRHTFAEIAKPDTLRRESVAGIRRSSEKKR